MFSYVRKRFGLENTAILQNCTRGQTPRRKGAFADWEAGEWRGVRESFNSKVVNLSKCSAGEGGEYENHFIFAVNCMARRDGGSERAVVDCEVGHGRAERVIHV